MGKKNKQGSNSKNHNKDKHVVENTHKTEERMVVKTDGGSIERPVYAPSKVDLDTTDYFEERSNPYSSKGN